MTCSAVARTPRARRSPAATTLISFACGVDRAGVDRRGDHLVDVDVAGASSGSSPCSRDSSMICWTRRDSRSLSLSIRPANRSTASGSSDASCDGLGQQADRADRRLELVADVGDEVAADRLDPALAGAVLDQREHEARAQRRHAGGHRACGQPGAAGEHELGLAGSGRRGAPAATSSQLGDRPSRCRGPGPGRTPARSAFSTTSFSSTTTALLRRTERRSRRRAVRRAPRLGGPSCCCRSLMTPGEDGTAADDGPEQRGQECLRRRIHRSRSYAAGFTGVRPRVRCSGAVFTPRSPLRPDWSPGPT